MVDLHTNKQLLWRSLLVARWTSLRPCSSILPASQKHPPPSKNKTNLFWGWMLQHLPVLVLIIHNFCVCSPLQHFFFLSNRGVPLLLLHQNIFIWFFYGNSDQELFSFLFHCIPIRFRYVQIFYWNSLHSLNFSVFFFFFHFYFYFHHQTTLASNLHQFKTSSLWALAGKKRTS